MSTFATSFTYRATLVVKSAHRLSHLLSTFHIGKLPICELDRTSPELLSRFVELCSLSGAAIVRVQNCSEFRRVHPVVSAHGLSDLLSTLRIRKRVVQDIPKKLLSICGTVVTFLCGKCPNCRTVVSLGRSLWAATLRPPNPHFGAWLRSLTFLVHSL